MKIEDVCVVRQICLVNGTQCLTLEDVRMIDTADIDYVNERITPCNILQIDLTGDTHIDVCNRWQARLPKKL
jgi:hypothetical protein